MRHPFKVLVSDNEVVGQAWTLIQHLNTSHQVTLSCECLLIQLYKIVPIEL